MKLKDHLVLKFSKIPNASNFVVTHTLNDKHNDIIERMLTILESEMKNRKYGNNKTNFKEFSKT